MGWDSNLERLGRAAEDPVSVPPLTAVGERRARRRLFLLTFLVVALTTLAYTWARPPHYRSDAVLSVVYEQGGTPVQEAFLSEQLVIHRQRLLGRQLLGELEQALSGSGLLEGQPGLSERLQVHILDDSRLLQLSVSGSRADALEPILSRWIALYLQRFETERASSAREERRSVEAQLEEMEARVEAKRRALEAFKAEHRIVSLERDENRTLSRMKALGAALDTAVEEQAQAASRLSAIRRSIRSGEGMVRPQDQSGIDQLAQRAVAIEEELREYAELYTPAYMAINTQVQALERKLALLKERIAEGRQQSQRRHEEEAVRELVTARQKADALREQLDGLEQEVQTVSNHLQSYGMQTRELEQLEQQTQTLRDALVALEVKEPHQSRVQVLEPPFVPDRPLSPDYWRDTGYSLAASLVAAALSILIFNLLNPRARSEILITAQGSGSPGLGYGAGPERLEQAAAPRLPGAATSPLSAQSCRQLVQGAEPLTALAIRMLLSGVRPETLTRLRWQALEAGGIRIDGKSPRWLALDSQQRASLESLRQTPEQPIWSDGQGNPLSTAALDTLIRCAALDAGIATEVSVDSGLLFDEYLRFMAAQRLMEEGLEALLGPLPEPELAAYRRRLPSGPLRSLDEVQAIHPAAL